MDKPAAAAGWMFVASYQQDVPVPLKARAYSLLARGWLDIAQENAPASLNISHLYDAGNCANEAVALGLISPAILMVAVRIESLGFRRPEDNKFPEHSTERFERLTDLWEALDARKAELAEESSRREAKVSKDPLSYFCAAEGCGIVATKKSTLRRCGGGCPRDFKPSYCSKYCQTAVRSLFLHPEQRYLLPGPSRIASAIDHTVDQALQNRAFVQMTIRALPPPSGDRVRRRRIRAQKSSSRVRSGPLA